MLGFAQMKVRALETLRLRLNRRADLFWGGGKKRGFWIKPTPAYSSRKSPAIIISVSRIVVSIGMNTPPHIYFV